ncbi:MAG: class I SAM-dependent methyltransferase [Halodesulfurarchaeum sp.]
MHDVPLFDRFAFLYDRVLPETEGSPLLEGFALADRPIDRVLDVGGGTGRAGRAVDPEAVVFDASLPMLESARSHGFETIRGDVRSIPLPAETIDGAVSVDAIHHLPDVPAVLEEVARVIRPGGVLVVRDFDPETIRGRMLALGERVVGFESTFLSVASLEAAVSSTGLDVTVLEDGFVYTVVGRKPSRSEEATNSESLQ